MCPDAPCLLSVYWQCTFHHTPTGVLFNQKALWRKERDVSDQIVLHAYVSGAISFLLSVLAWGMCGVDGYDRATVQGKFHGAKKCFLPSMIQPQFHVWGFLRAVATLIVNALLIKFFLRGELSVEVLMGAWFIELILLFVLYKVMHWWYKRDLDRCWAMHSTEPKDGVRESERAQPFLVVATEGVYESDRWE